MPCRNGKTRACAALANSVSARSRSCGLYSEEGSQLDDRELMRTSEGASRAQAARSTRSERVDRVRVAVQPRLVASQAVCRESEDSTGSQSERDELVVLVRSPGSTSFSTSTGCTAARAYSSCTPIRALAHSHPCPHPGLARAVRPRALTDSPTQLPPALPTFIKPPHPTRTRIDTGQGGSSAAAAFIKVGECALPCGERACNPTAPSTAPLRASRAQRAAKYVCRSVWARWQRTASRGGRARDVPSRVRPDRLGRAARDRVVARRSQGWSIGR